MYLIVTKTFPPEIGGMQNLMWGLANELSKDFMIKVFADYYEDHKNFVIFIMISKNFYHVVF